MPILDVRIVTTGGEEWPRDLAQRMADTAGEAWGAAAGRVWVQLSFLDATRYAENQAKRAPDELPVFVRVLMRDKASLSDRRDLARGLADRLAEVVDRPRQQVHLIFEPPGAGRVAFGGDLIEP